MKIARTTLIGSVAAILLFGGAVAYASYSTVTTGNVTVSKTTITISATQGVFVMAAAVGGISCSVGNGLSVMCPGTTIATTYTVDASGNPLGSPTVGAEVLTMTVKNNTTATISPAVTLSTGCVCGVLDSPTITMAPGAANPASINPSSSGVYTFIISALSVGSDEFAVTIAG